MIDTLVLTATADASDLESCISDRGISCKAERREVHDQFHVCQTVISICKDVWMLTEGFVSVFYYRANCEKPFYLPWEPDTDVV